MAIALPKAVFFQLRHAQKAQDSATAAFDRLVSGKKFPRIQDGPEAFFAQKSLIDAALKVDSYRAASDTALGAIDVSLSAGKAIKESLLQMKGVLIESKTTYLYPSFLDAINDYPNNKSKIDLSNNFDDLLERINSYIADSTYQGINLLSGRRTGIVSYVDPIEKIQFSDRSALKLTGAYFGSNSWYEWDYFPPINIGIFERHAIPGISVATLATSPNLTPVNDPFYGGGYYNVWKPTRLEGDKVYSGDPGTYLRQEVIDYSTKDRYLNWYPQTFTGGVANDVPGPGPWITRTPRLGLGLHYSYLYEGLATEHGVDGALIDIDTAIARVDSTMQALGVQANIIAVRKVFNNALAEEYRLGAQKIQDIDSAEAAARVLEAQFRQDISQNAVRASLDGESQIADMIANLSPRRGAFVSIRA